jgi:hypothetical protein
VADDPKKENGNDKIVNPETGHSDKPEHAPYLTEEALREYVTYKARSCPPLQPELLFLYKIDSRCHAAFGVASGLICRLADFRVRRRPGVLQVLLY